MATSRITATNENISTYGGAGRQYQLLATWEALTDIDLVTAEQSEVLEAYADDPSFPDRITFADGTTNATYFRILRAASGEGHGGIPGAGVHFTGTTATGTIVISEEYVSIQDIEVTTTGNAAGTAHGIQIAAEGASVIGCIAKSTNAGAGAGAGITVTGGVITIYVINSLAYECKTHGFWSAGGNTYYCYNCTSVDNGENGFFEGSSGTMVLKNCLGNSNTTADFSGGSFGASTYNASSDATAAGTNPRISQTFTFVDAASDDYHLASSDSGARGRGTDLRNDATFPFNDDIDFEVLTSQWSIGFDHIETDDGQAGLLLLLGVGR
jgi:hypothetical protein